MVMNDTWIKKMAFEHDMIVPFKDKQISEGKISSGLSSFGYDATLSDSFKLFTNVHAGIVDVKNFDDSNFVEKKAKEVLLPGNSFLLGATEEVFNRNELPGKRTSLAFFSTKFESSKFFTSTIPAWTLVNSLKESLRVASYPKLLSPELIFPSDICLSLNGTIISCSKAIFLIQVSFITILFFLSMY
jgi:hypothetical protein